MADAGNELGNTELTIDGEKRHLLAAPTTGLENNEVSAEDENHMANKKAVNGENFVEEIPEDDTAYCYEGCTLTTSKKLIGCDGDCPIEWFHVECVGIDPESVPQGSLKCPECSLKDRKNQVPPAKTTKPVGAIPKVRSGTLLNSKLLMNSQHSQTQNPSTDSYFMPRSSHEDELQRLEERSRMVKVEIAQLKLKHRNKRQPS